MRSSKELRVLENSAKFLQEQGYDRVSLTTEDYLTLMDEHASMLETMERYLRSAPLLERGRADVLLDELVQDASQPEPWKLPEGERVPTPPQQFQAFGVALAKARHDPQQATIRVPKALAEKLFAIVHELGWGYQPVFRETGGLWVCTTCKGTTAGPDHGWKDIAHGARCPHQRAKALAKYWEEAVDGQG